MTHTRDPSSHTAAGLSVAAIVEEAMTLIAENGVSKLTMNALAQRLGVRSPSLYHHVRDKAALVDLIAEEAFGVFVTDREAFDDVATLDEWIDVTKAVTLRLRDYYASHPGFAGVILATATHDRDQGGGPRASLVRAEIDALIRLGVPRPDARATVLASARWTMAAAAAIEDSAAGGRDDAIFRRGLNWLLSGVRSDLVRALGRDM